MAQLKPKAQEQRIQEPTTSPHPISLNCISNRNDAFIPPQVARGLSSKQSTDVASHKASNFKESHAKDQMVQNVKLNYSTVASHSWRSNQSTDVASHKASNYKESQTKDQIVQNVKLKYSIVKVKHSFYQSIVINYR